MDRQDEVKVEQQVAQKQEGVRIGKLVVLAKRDCAALDEQYRRFLAKGYEVDRTVHFLVGRQKSSDQLMLLHAFSQDEIDADLICFIEQELSPFGFIPCMREFGAALFGVLASTFPAPRHQPSIWRHFCVNSLNRLRYQMKQPPLHIPSVSYITPFASIYCRVAELYVGDNMLDAGASFGFLSILMAERFPGNHFIGCDNNPDAISLASDLATTVGTQHVSFVYHNVLASNFSEIGSFDTITAIHLLEHLPEEKLPRALEHLLQVTRRRLLIAVPYEEQATLAYGHRQVFTPEKLDYWGRWCIAHLQGNARYRCEEVMGGLLVIERNIHV